MFVIINTDTNKFLAHSHYIHRSGGKTYTDKLQEARIFTSSSSAEQHRCKGNEKTVALYDLLSNNIDDSNK